ncbi:tRNA1(Val) (adenine(37)-N6)-methyltransferase [Pseudidiomarina insulisalsae]|uniref:tRNA1(Val) (adenine(37)-N6)-methyltransferase n=1 Tax=Pseudidiomarina insulisalsae TaxID=575789 RepID=A0A432YCN1_9GAMM|nr:methyltransferase [Pseudidiomarina insulisalsae]RUO58765.1 methyltransferase [Pseudidiomarina insulisalsae]
MGFQCQQFYIKDDQCAMKVSTDSLILGSYAGVNEARYALDMGTGSGLLALMLAQRQPQLQVDAFDCDAAAVAQAASNVAASPWPGRVNVQQGWVETWHGVRNYDLIVCNPPYFSGHPASESVARQQARQGQATPQQWLQCIARNLHEQGLCYWILPYSQAEVWQREAQAVGLCLSEQLAIRTTQRKPMKLVVQGWQWQPCATVKKEEMLIHATDGSYSSAYRQLTGEFYLAGTGSSLKAQ